MYGASPCMTCMQKGNMCPYQSKENGNLCELESLYPRSYYIILPVVQRHCDRHEKKYGKMHTPSRRELDEMVQKICDEVQEELKKMMRDEEFGEDMTRFVPPAGPLMRDLVGTIAVGEMIGRRRRYWPPYGYPPYFGGYPPRPFPVYPPRPYPFYPPRPYPPYPHYREDEE